MQKDPEGMVRDYTQIQWGPARKAQAWLQNRLARYGFPLRIFALVSTALVLYAIMGQGSLLRALLIFTPAVVGIWSLYWYAHLMYIGLSLTALFFIGGEQNLFFVFVLLIVLLPAVAMFSLKRAVQLFYSYGGITVFIAIFAFLVDLVSGPGAQNGVLFIALWPILFVFGCTTGFIAVEKLLAGLPARPVLTGNPRLVGLGVLAGISVCMAEQVALALLGATSAVLGVLFLARKRGVTRAVSGPVTAALFVMGGTVCGMVAGLAGLLIWRNGMV